MTAKDRHIADYLIDEVLSRQSADVQEFLLQTSIFERMCGALCDAVLEIENSQSMLEAIERTNLFIIPLDNAREWYLAPARQLSDSVKNPFAKLLTMSHQGALSKIRGELHQAMDRFREAHEFGKQCRARQESTYSSAVIGIANIYYEWNRSGKFREYIDEAIGFSEKYDSC